MKFLMQRQNQLTGQAMVEYALIVALVVAVVVLVVTLLSSAIGGVFSQVITALDPGLAARRTLPLAVATSAAPGTLLSATAQRLDEDRIQLTVTIGGTATLTATLPNGQTTALTCTGTCLLEFDQAERPAGEIRLQTTTGQRRSVAYPAWLTYELTKPQNLIAIGAGAAATGISLVLLNLLWGSISAQMAAALWQAKWAVAILLIGAGQYERALAIITGLVNQAPDAAAMSTDPIETGPCGIAGD